MQYMLSVRGYAKPKVWMLVKAGLAFSEANKDWRKKVDYVDQDEVKRLRNAGFAVTWWKIDESGKPIPMTRRF